MPNDDCINWPGCKTTAGYGRINNVYAHRFMWEAVNGRKLPDGHSVCHSCDNPSCVNPRHLFAGTHQENMDDMNAKGRANNPEKARRGEFNGTSKLTDEDVREIRRRAVMGKKGNMTALAREYGIVHTALWGIVTRKTWKHIE